MDKRTFIKSALLGIAGTVVATKLSKGNHILATKNVDAWAGKFKLPELPYNYDAFESFTDAKSLRMHYEQHALYSQKFNNAVKELKIRGKSPQDILSNVSKYPQLIRLNGGGYYNHRIFWKMISPNGGGLPEGDLKRAIDDRFGSFRNFKSQFNEAAVKLFGAGWVWLIHSKGGLQITTTGSEDNPLMDIVNDKGFPLLALDMHPHAISSKFSNRSEYAEAFWKVVNWQVVAVRYAKKKQGI